MRKKDFDSTIRITYWVIAALIVLGVSYDLVISANEIPNEYDSISAVAKRLGWRYPVLVFAFSGLAAHFWINYDGYVYGWPADQWLLAGLHVFWWFMTEITRDLWAGSDTGVLAMMIGSMIAGLISYAIFWPQRPPSIDEMY